MPENVFSSFSRALNWVVNRVKEPRNWSPIEYEVIKGLCLQVGKRGTVRFRNFEDHGSFANMLTDLGSDVAGAARHTVLVPTTVIITEDTIVNANITLIRTMEGKFVITSGASLNFRPGSKLLTEPDVPAFDVSEGSVGVGGLFVSNAIPFLTPEMFGGGEAGLGYLADAVEYGSGEVHTDDYPTPIHIIKPLSIAGNVHLYDSTPIEYIKPGVTITLGAAAQLEIDSMNALYTHEVFLGTGTLILNNTPCRQRYLMLEDNLTPPANPPAGYAYLYFDGSDGNLPKIKDSAGNTFYIEITQIP